MKYLSTRAFLFIVAMVTVMSVWELAKAESTYRHGSRIIEAGDTGDKVFSIMGSPIATYVMTDRRGAKTSESWKYQEGKTVIWVTMQGERVVDITEVKL